GKEKGRKKEKEKKEKKKKKGEGNGRKRSRRSGVQASTTAPFPFFDHPTSFYGPKTLRREFGIQRG
ncbi:MAG: hypothetical protein ACKOWM_09085, partial [Sphingomonadales bacterium]